MASEAPINGNYAPHQGYGSIEQGQGGYSSTATSHAGYSNSTQSAAAANSTASEIPKDEVGWYFVEQYYTTLSRSPEKLYVSPLPRYIDITRSQLHSFSTTSAHSTYRATRPRRSLSALAKE